MDSADLASAQLLGFGREAEERVDPTSLEKLRRLDFGILDPDDVSLRIESHVSCHDFRNRCLLTLSWETPTLLPFKSPIVRIGSCASS